MLVAVNRCIGLAVLVAVTSVAGAEPEPLVFRVLRWSPYDLQAHQNRSPVVSPSFLANELVLSARGIEHVLADDNCCNRPGDSLRWIPQDRSVTPGR
jgi:hypothetical protein